MKIITISGSCSGVGKTTTLRALLEKMPKEKTTALKFGHGKTKKERPEKLFTDINEGLSFISRLSQKNRVEYLLVEGNSVLKFLNPDVSVFIEGDCGENKKSAELARELADIILL